MLCGAGVWRCQPPAVDADGGLDAYQLHTWKRNREDTYRVTLTNTGGSASGGSPISIADQLPAGLSLAAAGASGEDQLTHKPLTCIALTCTYSGTVVPEDSLTLAIPVDVEVGEATSVTNTVTASGGGGAEATMHTPTAISPSAAEFGIAPGGASTALSSLQAGAHADLTTAIDFDTINAQGATAGDVGGGFAVHRVGDLLAPVDSRRDRRAVRSCSGSYNRRWRELTLTTP